MKAMGEILEELNAYSFHPTRLGIMVELTKNGVRTAGQLSDDLGMTQGNLAKHLLKLCEQGFVEAGKTEGWGRQVSAYRISLRGAVALGQQLEWLETLVRQGRVGWPTLTG